MGEATQAAKAVSCHMEAQKGDQMMDGVTQGMRAEVVWFAQEMERRLVANDHKVGWKNCEASWLLKRLKQEIGELERAIGKVSGVNSDYLQVIHEAADVANFAMMIADNAEIVRPSARARP